MPTTIVDNGSQTEWIYSAYLQDEWKLHADLTVNYGLRFDQLHGLHQRRTGQPAIERGVAGSARHHRARGLFALPFAAAL